MPRAVLDPNVLVSGLISPQGPSAQLLLELHAGAFELVASPKLLAELSDVLHREKFRRYVTHAEVDAYVKPLRLESMQVDDPELASAPLSEDLADEYLIALARSLPCDALVSGDTHLTALRDRIPVLSPREFLEKIQAD